MKYQRFHILSIILILGVVLAGFPAFAQEGQKTSEKSPGAGQTGQPEVEQPHAPVLAPSTPQLIEFAYEGGQISRDTANLYLAYALSNDPRLPAEYLSNTPWDGTLPLLALQESLEVMSPGLEQEEVAKILTGTCSTSTTSLPNVNNSTHFHIEYDTIGGGLTINSYATSLETAWNTEIGTFGWWAPPVLASNPPPGNRYHVRIDALGSSLYGYVSLNGVHAGNVGDNPNTSWADGDAYASCMVLNRDYTGFPGSPQLALDATTAHEFNHSIQYGIGAITGSNQPDYVFIEGGASWMEDEVFDAANDNYNYLWPTFDMCMGEYTDSPYPYWVTWRGFTERYGTGAGGGEQVMQDFWEQTSRSATNNDLNSLNTALGNRSANLSDAFHAYAIAAKFNKTCGGSYAYPYCFEEAAGYTAVGGATAVHGSIAAVGGSDTGSIPNHYAINWISLPTSGMPYNVTLNNTAAGGQLRGSVVCDTGSELIIEPMDQVAGAGQAGKVSHFDPSGCSSVVAVITNQEQTSADPLTCTASSYLLEVSQQDVKSVYLPLILKQPANVIYGHVTDDGVAAPGVELALWFYNGASWSDVMTTTTTINGKYQFVDIPALSPGQKYLVSYINLEDGDTRLGFWETRQLTSFTSTSIVNIGDFDIADVALTSPDPESEAVPPRNFQWTPRPATPSDSYIFTLFDYYDENPSFESPPLGYVNNYTLTSLPPGFQYCNPYYWGILVNSLDGGWGASYWINMLTLHQIALSGIHGCVTEDGVPESGVPVTLWKWTGTAWSDQGTLNTDSNGYFQFAGKGSLNSPQFYVVEYYNDSDGPSRVGAYDTRALTPYTSSSSVHIGDFDIANIPLSLPPPGATVPLPNTFYWAPRPSTPWDSYDFNLFDPADFNPWFNTPPLGFVNQYTLSVLPGGFSYSVPYGWTIGVWDPFGGWGGSYYYQVVTFQSTVMSAAPAEGSAKLHLDRQQLEAIRRARLGQPQARLRLLPHFERLRGQR